MGKEKKFPPPRAKHADLPYRKPAPAPPPLAIEVKSAPIIEAPMSQDVFDELEKVEIDPKALEEARSSNRAWGAAMIVLGLFLLGISIAIDLTSSTSSRSVVYLPGAGVMSLAYGIRRWRLRGIEY